MSSNWICLNCKAYNPPRRQVCWQCGTLHAERTIGHRWHNPIITRSTLIGLLVGVISGTIVSILGPIIIGIMLGVPISIRIARVSTRGMGLTLGVAIGWICGVLIGGFASLVRGYFYPNVAVIEISALSGVFGALWGAIFGFGESFSARSRVQVRVTVLPRSQLPLSRKIHRLAAGDFLREIMVLLALIGLMSVLTWLGDNLVHFLLPSTKSPEPVGTQVQLTLMVMLGMASIAIPVVYLRNHCRYIVTGSEGIEYHSALYSVATTWDNLDCIETREVNDLIMGQEDKLRLRRVGNLRIRKGFSWLVDEEQINHVIPLSAVGVRWRERDLGRELAQIFTERILTQKIPLTPERPLPEM
jgi:hypothetical protein